MWHRLQPLNEWITAHRLALPAVQRSGHRQAELIISNTLGVGYRNIGWTQHAIDCFRSVVRRSRDHDDRYMEAQALNGWGDVLLRQGHVAEAKTLLQKALTLRDGIGYRRGVALTHVRLGQAAISEEANVEAAWHFLRARVLLVEEEDLFDSARALSYLGHALFLAGDLRGADALLRQAIGEFEEIGHRHFRALCYEWRGTIAKDNGNVAEARSHYERAEGIHATSNAAQADRIRSLLEEIHQP